MPPRISKERIERAARLYSSNNHAAEALGIQPQSFSRLCRRYGVLTPQQRRQPKGRPDRISKKDLGQEVLNHLRGFPSGR